MTKRHLLPSRSGWDNVADLDRAIRYDNRINEQLDHFPALRKVKLLQPALHPGAEVRYAATQRGHVQVVLRLHVELAELLAQRLLRVSELLALAFELLLPNHLGKKHIQEALVLAIKLCERLAEGLPTGLERLGQPVPLLRTGEFMRNHGWIGNDLTQILPDKRIEAVSRNVAGRTVVLKRIGMDPPATATNRVAIGTLRIAPRTPILATTAVDKATQPSDPGAHRSALHPAVNGQSSAWKILVAQGADLPAERIVECLDGQQRC